jgi:glucose-6-phosphate 1-dehydrogenase
VPFFIRTGKLLPITQTELRLVFHTPPRMGFHRHGSRAPEADQLVIKLDPTTGVRLLFEAQRGDDAADPEQVHMDLEFADQGGEAATPYEVLLHAAMLGDSTRFKRQDSVEETWRIMEPLVASPPPVHPYEPGSWGPSAADSVVAGHGRWHEPWVAS